MPQRDPARTPGHPLLNRGGNLNDQFARQTAREAHKKIAELTSHIGRLEKVLARRAGFVARCSLCGSPCRPNKRYCHAHAWAEGGD